MIKKLFAYLVIRLKPSAKIRTKIADEMIVFGRSFFLAGVVSPVIPSYFELVPSVLIMIGSIIWICGMLIYSYSK